MTSPRSHAELLLAERYEALRDALMPKAWWDEHRKRTSARLDCGCGWSLVEVADAGGAWMEECWVSCDVHAAAARVLQRVTK